MIEKLAEIKKLFTDKTLINNEMISDNPGGFL